MNFELRSDAGRAAAGKSGLRLKKWARLAVLALVLVVSQLPPLAAPAAAQQALYSAEEIAESRDRVLTGGGYQTERPKPEEIPEVDPLRIPPWLIDTLLWAAGIAVVLLVAYFLFKLALELWGSGFNLKRRQSNLVDEAPRVETVPPARREAEQRTLAEADALAAQGRFGEAIHLLLLVAMERLRRELGPRVAPAMTSREILHLAPLPGPAAEPLGRMVALSEIKHFGGRAASEPDYRNCREDYLRFTGLEPAQA